MIRTRPSGPPRDPLRTRGRRLLAAILLLVVLVPASLSRPLPAGAQDRDALRVGITLGGISFFGITFEYRTDDRGVDLTVGTWSFQDVSVSVVGKQYLGPEGLQPYVGGGLWGVVAFTDPRPGAVLVLRAPVGVDWRVHRENFLGAEINVNRGLWVRRSDPGDETPLNRRAVPLPGFYYRWRP